MQVFCQSAILAYECGYSESDMLLKLTEACDTSTSFVRGDRVHACVECVCIVWITLEQAPTKRWSTRTLFSTGCRVVEDT